MTLTALSTTLVILVSAFLVRKYREGKWGKCKSKKSMSNKTVIITGANSGIGKATAEELANRGARVIMACRDLKKAELAVAQIRKKTGNGELHVVELDLASSASIRKFANSILETEDRLDVLINNAGIFQCPFLRTEDGYEMQFGVNHLGHFFLTRLLLEKLKHCAPSRIINVTSALYSKGCINVDEINSEIHYDKRQAYSNSKLANILFTRELSKRLKGNNVNVYAVSPGMVWTNLGRYVKAGWLKMALLAPVAWLFVRMPKQGCQTVVHCAVSDEIEGESGFYYRDCAQAQLMDVAEDNELAKMLWDFSEKCMLESVK